jgi:hypothetical protein
MKNENTNHSVSDLALESLKSMQDMSVTSSALERKK